jgi:hypothetical protein
MTIKSRIGDPAFLDGRRVRPHSQATSIYFSGKPVERTKIAVEDDPKITLGC